MSKQILAITTCRVSTPEQLENNSLERQAEAVLNAANELEAIIPDDGQWSGSVSSKAGTNVNRKDLKEMLHYCKKHPQVKYLIVHEVDRFMRSVDELFYFEVRFREEVGVKIVYASQPQLNTDDHQSKLFKALEAFKGEGSNVERQKKSIDGQISALKHGRWPFAPKPGYKRGYEPGIPEIHPIRGPILSDILLKIVTRRITPTQALIELNDSGFMVGHSKYKMDKFRKIVTDPFYAAIVEIDKQVKFRNEDGLHEPLITKNQHYGLIRIMDAKIKTQSGPHKNGNPKYPVSNLVTCELCRDNSIGRLVGYDHTNGKKNSPTYEKYRCRSCGRLFHRLDIHSEIELQFNLHPITQNGLKKLYKSLDIVWRKKEGEAVREANRTDHKIKSLKLSIEQQIEAITEPSNASIKDEILASIGKKKVEISDLEDSLEKLRDSAEDDRDRFLRFAFKFVQNTGDNFLDTNLVSKENRLRCKDVLFPAGFYIDKKNKVYTPEVSRLYRLATTEQNHLVRVTGL
ncbi:MAG TPA: recombinase family protein [Candidatus Saccharimonadales bacterium]|nr:recombinase family protein [Candidatus Saccharimonadales bacterium]